MNVVWNTHTRDALAFIHYTTQSIPAVSSIKQQLAQEMVA